MQRARAHLQICEDPAAAGGEGAPLQIRYRRLRELVPYARNARRHPPAQKAILRASMLEYGWTSPMLIADDHMLAGHGRLEVALELAAEGKPIPRNPDPWSGPTVDLSHLSPLQRRAYVLMDNRSAERASWDPDMLPMELGELSEDLGDALGEMTGFDEGDIERLLGEDLPDPSDAGDGLGEEAAEHTCPHCGFRFRDET
jgi:ParB family transcriptional regulator, chromosome partitioning protein